MRADHPLPAMAAPTSPTACAAMLAPAPPRAVRLRAQPRYYSCPAPDELADEVFVLDTNTLKTSQSKLLLRDDTAQIPWLDRALGLRGPRGRWS